MSEALENRLAAVRERIAAACGRAGRAPESVLLLPVTKTHGPEVVREAVACGLTVFGENRVQEARAKMALCPGSLHWHLVGHLQTNKAKDAVQGFELIHSVDSARLLEAVDRACEAAGRRIRVCLEVNVSGERSKFGLPPAEAPGVLEAASRLFRVEIVGLMTIPPVARDVEESRPFFRRLRELRDEWQAGCGVTLPELSMGMSSDFEVAIEEGSTCVRLGTVLFGDRPAARAPREAAEEGA